MDLYKVLFDENDENGELYGISIVDSPANQYEFLALSEAIEEITLKATDKEKQLLTGVVLIPNQKIKRFTKDKGYFEIYFDEDTIERVSQDFFQKKYQSNTSYNHLANLWLNGTTVVESWIVEDPANDKSNALGITNLPKGTWMITMKLSDELWAEYIKTGKARGFSVDAYLPLEKVELNNLKLKKEKMSLLKQVIKFFSQTEEVKLASIEIEGMGTLTADEFEIGNIVYQEVDGAMVEAKTVSFNYDGFVYMTDETGTITSKDELVEEVVEEVVEMVEEEVKEEEVIEETPTEEVEEEVEMVEEIVEEEVVNEEMEALKAENEILKAEIETLKAKLTEKETEVVELSSLPREGKLKPFEINLSSDKRKETTLEVISRITKNK